MRRGHTERMVPSHDACCYIDWIDPELIPFLPQWHYTHLFEDVVPYFLEHGGTQEQIDRMLVDVTRRFFEN